jgi:hypothetical protein
VKAGTKLGAYGVVLAAVLGAGAAVGAVVGPIDVGDGDAHGVPHQEVTATMDETTPLPAAGLLVSEDGYHFQPEDRLADGGELAFTIVGPDGHAVRAYDLLHDRELHLIVASRDLQHFAHLHPTRDAEGRWSVELPDLPAGPYRAFADFQPAGGSQHTLGVDLIAPGTVQAGDPLRPQLTDTVDGYDVSLHRDADSSEVTVTVRRDGAVVTTEPYLGAAGHLVALRDGDLAYLHVHPLDEVPSGPVRFAVEVPSAGTYGLFFDFQIDGVVRTARFVLDVTTAPTGDAHGDAGDR